MNHPELAFGDDGDIVSIWVGSFGTREAVDAYIQEQYDEDRDDEPISPFAADIGLKSYDHDFMEVEYAPGLSNLGVTAFARHSYGQSFGDAAWVAAAAKGIADFDTVLMLHGYDHVRYPQDTHQPMRVRFVGTFPFIKPRDEWFERLCAGEFDHLPPGSY